MSILIPPPPHGKDESTQQDWFVRVRNAINKLGSSITWTFLDKTGSNLLDIETRNHSNLQNIQGGTHHLSSTDYTDLTDGGDSALHYHNIDRDRTNHTGTQPHTTITGGITITITTAKLTALGTNGSMTFENGILTAQTAAT